MPHYQWVDSHLVEVFHHLSLTALYIFDGKKRRQQRVFAKKVLMNADGGIIRDCSAGARGQ